MVGKEPKTKAQRPKIYSKQSFNVFRGPAKHSAIAALDYGALNQIRMFDHQRDEFFV